MKRLQINRGLLVGFLGFTILLAPLYLAYPADVILYDNTTAEWDAYVQVYWYLYPGGGIDGQHIASSFSTGSFSGALSSVVLLLHDGGSALPHVFIYGDNGGVPYSYLGQLTRGSGTMPSGGDPNNPIFGRVTYNASGISLAPNTTYWVVLGQGTCTIIQPGGGEVWWAEVRDTTSPCNEVISHNHEPWRKPCWQWSPQMQVIAATSLQPIANGGANGTAHEGSVVTLDGSGSSDPSGLSLTYLWELVSVPAGSTAALSDPSALNPSFTVDKAGDYIVQLVVTNSEGAASQPATVTISTYNTAPVADPGPDRAIVEIGTTVSLDGSRSYDADGDPFTYSWTFTSKPTSSEATINGDTTAAPTFVAEVQGTYVIQLIISDPWVASAPKTVTVSFDNVKPVANAGTGQLATVGDLVSVNGSGSSDANSDPLTYQWSFATTPSNSLATFANPAAVQATFVPDQPGTYGLQLIVSDGFVNSDPSTVQIQVTAVVGDPLITLVSDEIALIGSLDPLVFRNSNLQNTLINKLQAVMSAIQSDNYDDAVRKLQADVMGKTDGCAVSGAPDKNDWIVTCNAQQEVYANVMRIIERIR